MNLISNLLILNPNFRHFLKYPKKIFEFKNPNPNSNTKIMRSKWTTKEIVFYFFNFYYFHKKKLLLLLHQRANKAIE